MTHSMKSLAYIGTFTSVAGAFLKAFQIVLPAYIGYIVGSTIWTIIGKVNNDNPLFILNITFLVANIIGVYNVT